MNPDELARETETAEVEAQVLASQLDRLDPRTPWARTWGVEVDLARYAGDDKGRASYRHDLAVARRDWLRGRYDELSAREARKAEARERRSAGISRFLEGRLSLDDMTRPEFERQLDFWRLSETGPVSVRTAEANQEVLRELRGE